MTIKENIAQFKAPTTDPRCSKINPFDQISGAEFKEAAEKDEIFMNEENDCDMCGRLYRRGSGTIIHDAEGIVQFCPNCN